MPFANFRTRKDASIGVDPPQKPKRFGFLRQDRDKNKLSSTGSFTGSITSVESRLGLNEVEVPLLSVEEKCYSLDGSPISTLTWIQGDHTEAIKTLESKTRAIVNANPWLAGRITKRKGKPVLVHPDSLEDTDSDSEGFGSNQVANLTHVTNPKKSSLHRIVGIEDTADLCKPYLVQNSSKQLLWKVTVVPSCEFPDQNFAVIHSMSHVVADEFTYYSIHNMLMANAPIKPLQVTRLSQTEQLQKEVLGRKEFGLLDCPIFLTGLLSGVIKSNVLGSKNKKGFFLIDNSKLQEENMRAGQDVFQNAPPSNDALTSWFFRQTECAYGLLVTNFRNRLVGHTSEHAGNYANTLCLNPRDYASPRLIEASLANPPAWRQQTIPNKGRVAVVSDWASLAQDSTLQGCQEELHLPLFHRAKYPLPSNMSAGIIFRAGPGKTAIYVAGNSKLVRQMETADLVSYQNLE